jgi:uridine phosphorylase
MNEDSSDTTHFLGSHSTLSYLIGRRRIWRRIPYLRENEGRAPPVVLAVGDRRRVYTIAGILRKTVLLPETAAKLSHQRVSRGGLCSVPIFGRVAMAIGLTSRSIPVLVVETQMGAPATQIIMKENLSDKLTSKEYRAGKVRISLPHKVVIRVGTAGGINCPEMSPIEVGDIVNATHSIGATGTVIQSLVRMDFWQPGAMEEFRDKWTSLGPDFTITENGHPKVECSKDVVEALEIAGQKIAKDCYHRGGNITKDSLYAELGADAFVDLCRAENCRSTEMELSAIAVTAREYRAHFGMISGILGLLPGISFAESQTAKTAAENRSLRVALGAVDELVHPD